MEIIIAAADGRVPVTILRPVGNLDSTTSVIFKEKVDELIQNGSRYMLVDFTDIPYISSAALRALQATHKQLLKLHAEGKSAGTNKSPYLKLLNLCPNVRSVFKICGFDTFFEDFSNLRTAVDSF